MNEVVLTNIVSFIGGLVVGCVFGTNSGIKFGMKHKKLLDHGEVRKRETKRKEEKK